MHVPRRLAWMVLILLVASFMRLHDLPQIPPGMTHDEADHGLDAWGVVQGERPIYFTVGYGREPLYDYSTAALMAFLGPTFLAGRLTSVFFSLILIAGSYAWLRQALNGRVALLAVAGLSLGFWPLMTARQALRSEALPAVLVVAVAVFWRAISRELETGDWGLRRAHSLVSSPQSLYLIAGLLLGATFYTYIPSRILWLLFPALALYLTLLSRQAPWRGTALTLGMALLVGLPLFMFLLTNPGAEARIGQLAQPLQQAARGDLAPLWANVRSGLGIFTVAGDTQWRYNIAGRALLTPLAGILFYAGLLWSAWRVLVCPWRQRSGASQEEAQTCRDAPALFFALVWLALGLAPALATGRELSTTQAIGMQPVLYVFPALVLVGVARVADPWLRRRLALSAPVVLPLTSLLLGALLLWSTWRAYFQTWAQHPDVAVQYEAELVEIVRQLNETVGGASVAISTDAPGRFHDAATAQLFLADGQISPQWFDGRHGLLLPADKESLLVFSAAAPLNPALARYLGALEAKAIPVQSAAAAYEITHSPTRLLQLYPQFSTEINRLSTELSTDIAFGDAVRFVAYDLQTPHVGRGDTLCLATMWQVVQPPDDELVLFTHLLDESGVPRAQADRLDVPSHTWQPGDLFIQLHELDLPSDLPAGEYVLAVGVYNQADWRQRLPLSVDGAPAGDALPLRSVAVTP